MNWNNKLEYKRMQVVERTAYNDIKSAQSTDTFERFLQTHLFEVAYC